MQFHYALAEGAVFRTMHWVDTSGEDQEFGTEMEMFKHAGQAGWELVTVYVSGKTGNYRQYYFKMGTPYTAPTAKAVESAVAVA